MIQTLLLQYVTTNVPVKMGSKEEQKQKITVPMCQLVLVLLGSQKFCAII